MFGFNIITVCAIISCAAALFFLFGLVMYIRGRKKLKNSAEHKAYFEALAAYKAAKKTK